jgi:hypothetical protein
MKPASRSKLGLNAANSIHLYSFIFSPSAKYKIPRPLLFVMPQSVVTKNENVAINFAEGDMQR